MKRLLLLGLLVLISCGYGTQRQAPGVNQDPNHTTLYVDNGSALHYDIYAESGRKLGTAIPGENCIDLSNRIFGSTQIEFEGTSQFNRLYAPAAIYPGEHWAVWFHVNERMHNYDMQSFVEVSESCD